MYEPGYGNAQAAKVWIGRTIEAMVDKTKLEPLLKNIDDTLWNLWMGQLRGNDMQFYKWLQYQKGVVQNVYNDYVSTERDTERGDKGNGEG